MNKREIRDRLASIIDTFFKKDAYEALKQISLLYQEIDKEIRKEEEELYQEFLRDWELNKSKYEEILKKYQ